MKKISFKTGVLRSKKFKIPAGVELMDIKSDEVLNYGDAGVFDMGFKYHRIKGRTYLILPYLWKAYQKRNGEIIILDFEKFIRVTVNKGTIHISSKFDANVVYFIPTGVYYVFSVHKPSNRMKLMSAVEEHTIPDDIRQDIDFICGSLRRAALKEFKYLN